MINVGRALISVADKGGLIDFAGELAGLGIEIVSTGGTADKLRSAGIPVEDAAARTGFAQALSGRVKTLHPAPARRDSGPTATIRPMPPRPRSSMPR